MSVEAPTAPDERTPEEIPGADFLAVTETPPGAPIGVRIRDGGIIEVALPANAEIEGPEARVAGATVRALADGRRMLAGPSAASAVYRVSKSL